MVEGAHGRRCSTVGPLPRPSDGPPPRSGEDCMSWRVTVACTRKQAEAIATSDPFPNAVSPPVLVADEPDPAKPDEWLIHAYFEHEPRAAELTIIVGLGSGEPKVEQLGEADWVRMSQEGLQPIRAGRFYV